MTLCLALGTMWGSKITSVKRWLWSSINIERSLWGKAQGLYSASLFPWLPYHPYKTPTAWPHSPMRIALTLLHPQGYERLTSHPSDFRNYAFYHFSLLSAGDRNMYHMLGEPTYSGNHCVFRTCGQEVAHEQGLDRRRKTAKEWRGGGSIQNQAGVAVTR